MKYRKRPIVIEATQFRPDKVKPLDLIDPDTKTQYSPEHVELTRVARELDVPRALMAYNPFQQGCQVRIETKEGWLDLEPGAWVIKGIEGEIYPCDDGIFQQTYDRVDDAEEEAT